MYDQNPRTVPPPQADDVDDFLSRYTKRRVREEAQRQGVDPDLLERQFKQESAYKPDVIRGERRSSAGAIGPAQLMPGTAKDLKVDPYNIDQNIEGGARYMRQQLDAFGGDRRKALAAYNAGPGAVQKYGGVPPYRETQNYVNRIEGQGRGQRQQPQDDIDEFLSRYKEPEPVPWSQTRTPSTTTPNVFSRNSARQQQQATQEAQQALDFRNVNPLPEAQRLTGRVMSNPGAEQRRKIADQYNQKDWLGQRGEDVRQGWESFKTGAADAVLGAADIVGSAAAGDLRPLKETARGIGYAITEPSPFLPEAQRAKAIAERERGMQQLAQERNARQAGNPNFRRIQRERQEQQLAREAAPSMTSRVTRGVGDAVLGLPAMVGAAELGGIPAVTALTAAQQDFARDPQGAALNTAGAGLPILAGRAVSPIAARAAGRVAPALQRPVQLGVEGAAGGAANVGQYAATQAALGREIDPQEVISQGITGAVLSGAMAPKLADVQARNAASDAARLRQRADATRARENAPTAPAPEPPAASVAPDAPPTTPVPQTPAAVLGAPRREDFPPGWEGNMKFRAAQIDFQRSGAAKAAKAPKPQMAANDLRAQVDALKIEAQEAEGAGNPASAAAKYEAAQNQLGQLRAQAKAGGDAQLYSAISEEMAINKANWQAAGRAARSAKPAPVKQAVSPAEPLPSQEQQPAIENAPTRDLTAPLPAGEAKTPQAVEEITRTTAEIPRVRPQAPPVAEAVAPTRDLSAPLPPFPKLTPLTNRITEGASDELPRRVSQPLEGQPIEPPTRFTEYEGGEMQRYSKPLEGQPVEVPEKAQSVYSPEEAAVREREALPPVERRRALREAALKGQFGKLSEASRARATENRSLVGNAQLRRLLGLPEMPAYRLPDAEINPKTGEPYVNPEWNEAAQDTLNAMAALAGKERSSQINFGAGDAGSRGEMGDLFMAVRKLAQQKGEALEPALREAFRDTVKKARKANEGYQEFQVDERVGNIKKSLYELTRRGELTRDEIRAHQDAWREVAAEFGLSRNQADELFKGMRTETRTRAERAGARESAGADRSASRGGTGRVVEPVEQRATGTDGKAVERAAVSEVAKLAEAPKAPITGSQPVEAAKASEPAMTDARLQSFDKRINEVKTRLAQLDKPVTFSGGGKIGRGMKSRVRQVDSSVRDAAERVRLQEELATLEQRRDAYAAGKTDKQGRSVTPIERLQELIATGESALKSGEVKGRKMDAEDIRALKETIADWKKKLRKAQKDQPKGEPNAVPQAPDVARDPGANREAGPAAAVPPTEPVTPGKTPLSTLKNIIRRAREREAAKGEREDVAELRRMKVDDNPFAQSLRTMNEAELAAEIAEMGGDPATLRNNKELMVRWLTREIGRKTVAGEYGNTPDVSAKKAEFEELQRKPSPEQLRASALDKLKLSEDDAIKLMDTLAESEKNAANPYLSAEERAKYNQAWDQFFDAELTDAEANRLKGLYQQSRKPKFVSDAEARLNEYFSGKRAGSGVEQLVDTTIVAGYKAYQTGVKFRDWAKTVIDEVGERARPYLQKVWRDLKADKPEQQTRAALGKQMAREALLRAKAANLTPDEAATLLRQMGAEAPKDADPARFAVSLASALEKLGTNNVAEARNKVQKFLTPTAFGDAAQKFREVVKAGRELRASGLTADEVWTLRDAVPLDQSRAAALTNRTPEQRAAAGQKAAQTRTANVAARQEQTRSTAAQLYELRDAKPVAGASSDIAERMGRREVDPTLTRQEVAEFLESRRKPMADKATINTADPNLTREQVVDYMKKVAPKDAAPVRQADKPEMGEDAALTRLKRLQEAAAKVPSFVAEQQRILDEYKSGKRSGSGGEQLFAQAVVTGHKLYRAGMDFAQWSKAVIQEAGEAVRPHLRRAWEKVRDAQSFGELPKTRADVENSPAFKRWFRGSKVADGEGKPIPVYHGTQSPTEITALDYSKLDPNALYGPGFYTTQDPNIAAGERGYADSKQAVNPQWESFLTRRADYDDDSKGWAVYGPDGEAVQEGGKVKTYSTWEAAEEAASALQNRNNPNRPHAYKLYLNIKKPFPVDGSVDRATAIKLLGAEGEKIWPERFGNPSGQWVYEALLDKYKSKAEVNLMLQAVGYDGITHIGGTNTRRGSPQFDTYEAAQEYAKMRGGSAAAVVPEYDPSLKVPQVIDEDAQGVEYRALGHRVWIAFHPEQIKSYTGNRGTFDANNPSILMADPFGAGATLFGGKKILDNLRAGRRKLPPKEIPKDFKAGDWITAQMENMAKRTLSDADKAKLADPKLPEAGRLRILANAKITPEQEAGFERAADDAFNALQANDYNGFQDAAQRMKFITDAPATNWQKASAIRKAAMLSRPVSHLRNLLGNTAFQNLEEVSRVPGSVGDILLGTVTGQRTLEGASVEKSARAIYAAATDGWQAAKDAMAGRNNEDFMKALQVKEVHFNTPFVDKAVKKVFRLLGAEDQIFYTGAYDRAIREAASLTARNEARQGIIARTDVEAREKALLAAPTAQMEVDAALAANIAVFRNDNALSDTIGKVRDSISDKANFALDLFMPFDRTPTNVILRALEYSPLGLARGAAKGVAGSARAIGAKRAAKKAGTPSKADVQAAIDEAFTPQQQRSAAQLLGRGTVGTGLLALGYVLASKGLMTGFYDEDDWRGEALKRASGAQPLAIQIGGRWWGLAGIGPIGMALGMGATMHDESKKKNGSVYGGAAKAAKEQIMEMPLLSSMKDLGRDVSRISQDDANAGKAVGNLAASFIPGIINDVGQVIPGVRDPFEREVKDNPKKVKGMRRALREGSGQVAARIPGVRRMLPVKKDITGKPVESRLLAPIDPFNSRQAVRPLPKR